MLTANDTTAWLAFGLSTLLFACYEARVWWVAARHPERTARSFHARMRARWASTLASRPGFEIVAVQTLRNSLMSATIAASTAALALMGTITVAGQSMVTGITSADVATNLPLRPVLEALLVVTLFASYVCSAMAMRYFNHVGFVMSMPADSPERRRFDPMAAQYVERAGLLYSWGMRFFLMIAPLVAGIVNVWVMLPITILLILVLWFFDRPAPIQLSDQ